MQKIVVALNFRNKSVLHIVMKANHCLQMISNNPYLSIPLSLQDEIKLQADKVQEAKQLSLTRVSGAATLLHLENSKLMNILKELSSLVELAANSVNDRNIGLAIVESCGLQVKKPHGPHNPIFKVIRGPKKGTALLTSKALYRSTCIYQMTTTPLMESSWKIIYAGVNVNFLIDGLVSGTRYYFRYARNIKGIQSSWSHVLNVLID
jgi:hypothetical protein